MIDKIRYWCHKILPLVYDDSLSYYEFLCKMNAKLNEVIDTTNGLVEAWEHFQAELEKAWQDYKSALTAEWTDYRAEMDLKYSTLVGTVTTEINAMKNDISTFKTDISNQITTFEAKVEGDYAEFTTRIEEKINTFIAKYNAEIAKIPDEITAQVNAWWQNETNYNTLVENVANAIGTTLASPIVSFNTVADMQAASAETLPAKSIAMCNKYYNNADVITLWVIVSGDVSDGVSRRLIGSDRTAVLLSAPNADTLGLRGASHAVGKELFAKMCAANYNSLEIVTNNTSLAIPKAGDMPSTFTPLTIYGHSADINVTLNVVGSTASADVPVIRKITGVHAKIVSSSKVKFTTNCYFENADVDVNCDLSLQNVSFDNCNITIDTKKLTLAPIASDHNPHISNCYVKTATEIAVTNSVSSASAITIDGNALEWTSRPKAGVTKHFFLITGNSRSVILKNNTLRSVAALPSNTYLVLANCADFTENNAIVCVGNTSFTEVTSNPVSFLTGNLSACDVVYTENGANDTSKRMAFSLTPSSDTFDPARVIGVTSPIGYLRTSENLTVLHGTPLTLSYPKVSYWTSGEGGVISLSSDTSAEYKVTFRATVRLSGQESTGNAKITLSGRATDSRTFSVVTGLEYVPISFDFYWGTGGGFSIIASSETENMTLFIREAEILIERIR